MTKLRPKRASHEIRLSRALRLAYGLAATRRRRQQEQLREQHLRRTIRERLFKIEQRTCLDSNRGTTIYDYEEHRQAGDVRGVTHALHGLLGILLRRALDATGENTVRLALRELPVHGAGISMEADHSRWPLLGALCALDRAAARLRREGFSCTFGYEKKIDDVYDDRSRTYGTYKDVAFDSFREAGIRSAENVWLDVTLPKIA